MERTHHLVTLAFSHYNERARWALDLAGIPFTERAFMPGFSQLGVMMSTRWQRGEADRVSSVWSTPALRLPDGRWLRDSGAIVDFACEAGVQLRGEPDVDAWEQRLHDKLGPHTRRMAYYFALQDPSLLQDMADTNVGRAQAWLFKRLYPMAAGRLRRRLKIDEAGFERSRAQVDAIFGEVEAAIADTGYLVGDRFTAADLTFACMAAPLVLVQHAEGYSAHLPALDGLRPNASEVVEAARRRPAGQHALRMFREHRSAG
ncbi:MAG: glutathione S-transferase family protein [Myxococcota bacterium]